MATNVAIPQTGRTAPGRAHLALAALIFAARFAPGSGPAFADDRGEAKARPNIVFILADDK